MPGHRINQFRLREICKSASSDIAELFSVEGKIALVTGGTAGSVE